MLESLLTAVAGAVVSTISAGGYLGVVLLMAIESACIPLPSEMIMPFAGYLASTGRFTLVMAATAGAVGCNLGSAAAYEIGRHGGRPLVERWGSYILLGRHDVELADRFFARWGSIAVLVARLLPVVRTFIALPAGLAAMSRWRFHVYTFVGSWPWCFALAYVGYVLGEQWASDPRLRAFMHWSDAVILIGLLALLAWFGWRHWRQRLRTGS